MFRYESVKEILIKINNSLADIEVKGMGVQNMFLAQAALKDIFDSLKLENIPKEKEG